MTGISSINTNTGTSSNTNTEISFNVYAGPGTKLYKNGRNDPDFLFDVDHSFTKVLLSADNYISFTSEDSNIRSINIRVENENDFAIDVTRNETVTSTSIKAKSIGTMTVTKSDKIFVSKEGTKANGTDAKSESRPKRDTTEKKATNDKADIKGEDISTADFNAGKLNIEGKCYVKLYGDEEVTVSSSPDKNGIVNDFIIKKDLELRFHSEKEDDYFYTKSKGNIQLENKNSFSIAVTVKNSSGSETFYLDSKEKISLTMVPNVTKVFVTKEKQGTRPIKPARFTLDFYGEQGVELYKNGDKTPYYTFSKKDLSGVQVYFNDNDYIDIGKDKNYEYDERLDETVKGNFEPNKHVSQYTVGSSRIRKKKRRLRIRNRNNFFIIVIAEDLKTYLIGSFSESIIFFGKDPCKLYMLKGKETLTNKLPVSNSKEINIYFSFFSLPENCKIKVTTKSKDPSIENTPITFSRNTGAVHTRLQNNQSIELELEGMATLDVRMIVASDSSNQNVMTYIKDYNPAAVIKPGGVEFLQFKLTKGTKNNTKIIVTNCLIQSISVYETNEFRIPFKVTPEIIMSTSLQVDLLNTSLLELQEELQKERKSYRKKRNKAVGDCDVLTKMLYSTFFPSDDKSKQAAAWAFAVLFSHERGMDKVLITAMALAKKFEELKEYVLAEKLFTTFLGFAKSKDYYRSNVTDLMQKDNLTFLFELNMNENGFIVCMYRPAKKETLWDDPWDWFTDLPI